LISHPAHAGISSSSSSVKRRAIRVLAWPRFAQEDDVLAGEDCVLDLRQHALS